MKGFGDLYKSEKKRYKKNKFSNEQINQAIQLHLKGNISEAEKYYQQLINQGCKNHTVFSNYGVILIGRGKLKDAEKCFRESIKFNPDYAMAHCNLGGVLRDIGKFRDAEISTRKAIALNPDYPTAHSNLGNILRELNNLEEAEISTRKAIELNPNCFEAHTTLGNILCDIGKFRDAEISTRKAIALNPDYPEANCNLGAILSNLGNLKEAEISTRKAIALNPNYVAAHYNLGSLLSKRDNLKEGFDSYIRVIEINPKNAKIYPLITRFISDSDPSKLNKSKLKKILTILLERNDISHTELFSAFNFLYKDEISRNLGELSSDFFKNKSIFNTKLLITALKKMIFSDFKLELLLREIRSHICGLISNNRKESINHNELEFIIALGEQCFLNEYVYSISKEEKKFTDLIIDRCKNDELNELNISILSCYFPLYKLLVQIPSLKSFTSSNQSFNELIGLQIIEPLQEIEFKKNIKRIGSINDDISQKVKSQYEENPYPRWRYGNHSENQKICITKVINNEIGPNYITKNLDYGRLNVLIAGCGTGKQILQAQTYRNAKIVAIDLSLSSLAYAQRKITELGIYNVELIQMDILEVPLLEMKFDIIECGGVLHHMNNPIQGLKALLNVLKKTGFLKLGLYSELARQDVVQAKNHITRKGIQANHENIRNFRQKVFSGELSNLNSLKNIGDFYSLSECRDLCFHVQEHRFTIDQLAETLKSNELKFLGFLLQQPVKSLYKQYFPEDETQTNLQNWKEFEKKHPTTFSGMYQFWVSKF